VRYKESADVVSLVCTQYSFLIQRYSERHRNWCWGLCVVFLTVLPTFLERSLVSELPYILLPQRPPPPFTVLFADIIRGSPSKETLCLL